MKIVLCYISGGILALLFCFFISMLAGCSRKTPVENAFHNVETSIVAVKEKLPPECQTKEVLAKIDEIEWKSQMAEQVCQAKIKDTETKYERVLWVLVFIGLAVFCKNLIKK